MKIFLSFHFDSENQGQNQFVYRVSYYLRKQSEVESYCYTGERTDQNWQDSVGPAVMKYDKFVLFFGNELGTSQKDEAQAFIKKCESKNIGVRENACAVLFNNAGEFPHNRFQFHLLNINRDICDLNQDQLQSEEEEVFEEEAHGIAKEIVEYFRCGENLPWISSDGLPMGYPFCYEKKIISEFVDGKGRLLSPTHLEEGCPIKWPVVKTIGNPEIPNPVPEEEIGTYRPITNCVIVDVMGHNHCSDRCHVENKLTFSEAGPRARLLYPNRINLKVGIVVSGGIAPGINAVINGIVQRHLKYKERHNGIQNQNGYNLLISMYRDGLEGIRTGDRIYNLENIMLNEQLNEQSTLGGSMINTSRFDKLLDINCRKTRDAELTSLVYKLAHDAIDVLYVIGGDGSMRAAHAIYTRAQEMLNNQVIDKRISVVGIPKTMDNDILWVWQSFGFLSAVEKAKEFIVQLNTEAKSNPRLCIVQLFGSDSGFVVSHAALASGACMAALIPEVNFTMKKLSSDITKRLWDKYYHRDQEYGGQSPFGLVLLGETAIPQDVEDYIDNFKSYPDLGLEEGEKEAIRKFMNSSLLCRTDVKDWEALINELNNSTDDSPCRRLLDLLPCEVKGILEQTSALEDDNFKFLVLISFNNILKMEDFYIPELFNNLSFTAEFNEVNSILNDVKEITETDSLVIEGDMIKSLVQKLENVPISCEAKEILNLLKNRSKREGEDWENVSRQENLPFFQRLRKRLTEKFNRLLLEVIFSDQIISRSSSLQRERRVQGQTPDELRKGGVKIVSGVLKKDIQGLNDDTGYFRKYRVFVNEPRHLIRAIAPSVSDVIFGQRLGTLAVDNAMAGYTDFMVSQWLTEYVMVPLKLVVLGRKRVPPNGIFWKSVLAGTGQEPEMV